MLLLMKLSGHQSQKIRFICKNLRSQTRGVVKSVTDSKGWVYGESKSFNGWRREEGGGASNFQCNPHNSGHVRLGAAALELN